LPNGYYKWLLSPVGTFPIIDLHASSEGMARVGDTGLEPFVSDHLFNSLTRIPANQLGAQVVATSHVLARQASTPALVANRPTLENKAFCDSDRQAATHKMPRVGDEGLELLPFTAVSRAICVEHGAESDAYLHEKAVVEQFKLFQPLFSTEIKQALLSELVGSLVEG